MMDTGILRLAVYQHDAQARGPSERLEHLGAALANASTRDADLLICPELFMSGYNIGAAIAKSAETADGPFRDAAAALTVMHGVAVVYGYPEVDGDKLYNSAICLDRSGAVLANHRKLRLPGGFEKEVFTAGDTLTLFSLSGWVLGLCICYDAEFPEVARACARGGADALLVPTALQDKWAFVARAVMPTRAFENGMYLAYANHAGTEGNLTYLGESRIDGPDGLPCAVAGSQETIIVADLEPARVRLARETLGYLADSRDLGNLQQ